MLITFCCCCCSMYFAQIIYPSKQNVNQIYLNIFDINMTKRKTMLNVINRMKFEGNKV